MQKEAQAYSGNSKQDGGESKGMAQLDGTQHRDHRIQEQMGKDYGFFAARGEAGAAEISVAKEEGDQHAKDESLQIKSGHHVLRAAELIDGIQQKLNLGAEMICFNIKMKGSQNHKQLDCQGNQPGQISRPLFENADAFLQINGQKRKKAVSQKSAGSRTKRVHHQIVDRGVSVVQKKLKAFNKQAVSKPCGRNGDHAAEGVPAPQPKQQEAQRNKQEEIAQEITSRSMLVVGTQKGDFFRLLPLLGDVFCGDFEIKRYGGNVKNQ